MSTELVKLPLKFMHVTGPETEKFLQGQCSIDIENLKDDEFSFGTFNDPKGRMYCLFKACRYQSGILLAMHESLYSDTNERLAKYKVFSKCEINEVDLEGYGSSNQLASVKPSLPSSLFEQLETKGFANTDGMIAFKLPNSELVELWLEKSQQLDVNDSTSELSEWKRLEFMAGIPSIEHSTAGQYILQELNLQELGAVSFKKGCYTGQEIIARMKFLGKNKKRMYLLTSKHNESSDAVESLAKVSTKENKKLGKVICTSFHSDHGNTVLAVLNSEVLGEETSVSIENSVEQFKVTHLSYTD